MSESSLAFPGATAAPPRSPSHPLLRLVEIVLEPARGLRDAAETGQWAVALIATAVLRLCGDFMFFSPSREPARVIAGLLLQMILLTIMIAGYSLVLRVIGGLASAGVTYTRVFSVVIHAFFAYTLLSLLAAAAARALLPENVAVSLGNPAITNLGLLVDPAQNRPLNHLLVSFDLLVFYQLTLITAGLRWSARSAGWEKSAAVVGVAFSLYLAFTVGVKVLVS